MHGFFLLLLPSSGSRTVAWRDKGERLIDHVSPMPALCGRIWERYATQSFIMSEHAWMSWLYTCTLYEYTHTHTHTYKYIHVCVCNLNGLIIYMRVVQGGPVIFMVRVIYMVRWGRRASCHLNVCTQWVYSGRLIVVFSRTNRWN